MSEQTVYAIVAVLCTAGCVIAGVQACLTAYLVRLYVTQGKPLVERQPSTFTAMGRHQ